MPLHPDEKVDPVNVAEEMSKSFLDYSMSVIISRALPDARDGLKPSQRRILYSMNGLGVLPNRKHTKCAKIVGETMGNYHPHGDMAIYPTLVHMAQPWAMRERLVDGQGNFGSMDGDPPASMRYTEARLTHLGAILMEDMERDTVNIPPHNLGEIVDAICELIDNPEISIDRLLELIKGPDFPTGCTVYGTSGIRQYFETGRGSLKVRGKATIEAGRLNRESIIITEIPFNVNRADLIRRIAALIQDKVITEISDVRDLSDENTRIELELKRDANANVVLNNLYKHTALESTFAVNMLAIDHGRPKLLSIRDALHCFIEHRREVVLRRTRYLLRQAEQRAETLEGYLIALANLDDFIEIIRSSANREEARVKLLAYEFSRQQVEQFGIRIRSEARLIDGRYAFSETQADHILELRLYQLTGLEREKIANEYGELLLRIDDLTNILERADRVMNIIKEELQKVREKYDTPRVTQIVPAEGDIDIEDLIANEGCIITITHGGYIKRTPESEFRAQRRGGRGVIGMATREAQLEGEEGDFVEHLFTASTHDSLMFFTQTGRCYIEKVYEIPQMSRASKGRAMANLLELRPEEKIAATLRIEAKGENGTSETSTWNPELHIMFATRRGLVKKTNLSDFANVRKGGIIAIQIEEDDELIDALLTNGSDEVVLITHNGMSIRFHEEEARDMGRNAVGVWGIRPAEGDEVVGIAKVVPDAMLLVAGSNGIGKRTGFDAYRRQSRGGKGIITMKTSDRTGDVIGALTVHESDEVMLITTGGQMVRIRVSEIREAGRNTMGVKLINLIEGEKLQDIAPVVSQEEMEESEPPPS